MSFARIVAALGGLLAVLFGYITIFNRGDTTLVLWSGRVVTLPMSVLVLAAVFAGACFVLLMVAVTEMGGAARVLGRRRRLRRERRFEALFVKGCDLADLGLADRALSCFERILDHDAGNVSALVQLGVMRRRQGDAEVAIRYHKRALEREPTHIRALVALVEDCLDAERWQEALEVCGKLLEVEGEARRVLVWSRDLQVRLGRLEEAIDTQRHLMRHEGLGSEAHRMLRRLQFLQAMARAEEGSAEAARKQLMEILRQERTFVPAQVELGRLLLAEGKEKEAVRRWREGYGQTHDVVFLHLLERYYLGREDPDAAIAVYLNALKDAPASVELQFCLGKLYLRLEMLDNAYDTLRDLADAGASFPALHRLLGEVRHRRGDDEAAFGELQACVPFRVAAVVPYRCRACGGEVEEWHAQCPACGAWESLVMPIETEQGEAEG